MQATIIQTRRFVLSCLMAIMASGFTAAVASAEQCSDFTPGGRSCTATESHGYCLTTAGTSFSECLEDGGIWWDVIICGTAFDFDILACTASLPFNLY